MICKDKKEAFKKVGTEFNYKYKLLEDLNGELWLSHEKLSEFTYHVRCVNFKESSVYHQTGKVDNWVCSKCGEKMSNAARLCVLMRKL